MNCLNCNKEIEQKGNKPKRYCSHRCQLAHRRKLARDDRPINETIEGETIGNETIETPKDETIEKPKFKVMEEKGFRGEDLYFCSEHGNHCKKYCEHICDKNCHHTLEENKRVPGICRWCGKEITEEAYGNNWELVECCYSCVKERNGL